MTTIQRYELTAEQLEEIEEYGTLDGEIVEWDDNMTQVTIVED